MTKKQIFFIILLIVSLIILGISVISNLGTHSSTDTALKINNKYSLNRTSAHSVNLTDIEELTFAIKPNIEEFNYDKDFIIATRSSISKDVSYWIIDMEKNKTYGPMDEEKFKIKKSELSVELKLKKVSEFFK